MKRLNNTNAVTLRYRPAYIEWGTVQYKLLSLEQERRTETERNGEAENGTGGNGLEYRNCQKCKHVNGRRVWNKDDVILNKTYEKGNRRNAENISGNAEMVGAEPQ